MPLTPVPTADDEEVFDPPADDEPAPDRIGRYRIVRRLGEGGMGDTFEAVLEGPNRFAKRVCLKRVQAHLLPNPLAREEFRVEARLLAKLDHPGIVAAFDAGEHEGEGFLVMELVDGIDLSGVMGPTDERPDPSDVHLRPDVVAFIGAEVAEALHYLHTYEDPDGEVSSIVHRDVSPQNILLSRHGNVKLTDFGIAKFAGRPKFTQTHHERGKPPYLPPDSHLDGQSDLFSLGCVLYEALAAKVPFDGPSGGEFFNQKRAGDFIPLRVLAPHVDPQLASFIESMMAAEKEDRPKDALHAAVALRSFVTPRSARATVALMVHEARLRAGGEPADGPPAQPIPLSLPASPMTTVAAPTRPRLRQPGSVSASPATSPPARRSPLIPWVGGGALLVAAALVAGLLWPRDQPSLGVGDGAQALETNASVSAPPQQAAPPLEEPASDIPAPLEDEPDGEQGSSPPPESDVDVAVTAPEPTKATPSRTKPRRSRTSRRTSTPSNEPGGIRVRVLNWGYVWVDGELKGRAPAPVVVQGLTPGEHLVGASHVLEGEPHKTRTVEVSPGETTEVEIRLNQDMFSRDATDEQPADAKASLKSNNSRN